MWHPTTICGSNLTSIFTPPHCWFSGCYFVYSYLSRDETAFYGHGRQQGWLFDTELRDRAKEPGTRKASLGTGCCFWAIWWKGSRTADQGWRLGPIRVQDVIDHVLQNDKTRTLKFEDARADLEEWSTTSDPNASTMPTPTLTPSHVESGGWPEF